MDNHLNTTYSMKKNIITKTIQAARTADRRKNINIYDIFGILTAALATLLIMGIN